jgi:type IV pilus assembly protein PilB
MTEFEAEALQTQAAQAGATFVDHVIANKKISATQLAVFASRAFGVPLFDLAGFDTDQFRRS